MTSPVQRSSSVAVQTEPRQEDAQEKIRYLFDTLRAINTPSSNTEGALRPWEFKYTVAHSVPLINLKAQGTQYMPTVEFLDLARKVKELGAPLPEKNTIGGRMLVHGNQEIRFLGMPLIGSTEGLIERHALQRKISMKESEKEVMAALYP